MQCIWLMGIFLNFWCIVIDILYCYLLLVFSSFCPCEPLLNKQISLDSKQIRYRVWRYNCSVVVLIHTCNLEIFPFRCSKRYRKMSPSGLQLTVRAGGPQQYNTNINKQERQRNSLVAQRILKDQENEKTRSSGGTWQHRRCCKWYRMRRRRQLEGYENSDQSKNSLNHNLWGLPHPVPHRSFS